MVFLGLGDPGPPPPCSGRKSWLGPWLRLLVAGGPHSGLSLLDHQRHYQETTTGKSTPLTARLLTPGTHNTQPCPPPLSTPNQGFRTTQPRAVLTGSVGPPPPNPSCLSISPGSPMVASNTGHDYPQFGPRG